MKKAIFCATAAAMLFALFGCKSAPAAATNVNDTINGVPAWVANKGLKSNTAHYEVGYGKGASRAAAQKKAEANARNKLALWLQTDVEAALVAYTQDAGIEDEGELEEFMEEVSMQTAEASHFGAAIESVFVDGDGGVYVLMSYSMDALAERLQACVDSYVRSESAAFAEFNAREALGYLLGE